MTCQTNNVSVGLRSHFYYALRTTQRTITDNQICKKKQQHTWKTRAVATLARSHMRDLQSFKKSWNETYIEEKNTPTLSDYSDQVAN